MEEKESNPQLSKYQKQSTLVDICGQTTHLFQKRRKQKVVPQDYCCLKSVHSRQLKRQTKGSIQSEFSSSNLES